MIKKILCIILLLILIVANVQICFADSINDFLYNSTNSNITSINASNMNQNENLNNLSSGGYSSLISRYSKQYMHVEIDFISFQNEFVFNSSQPYYFSEFKEYIQNNISNEFVNNLYSSNNLLAINIDSSNLSIYKNYAQYSASRYSFYYNISGKLSFDMPLTNYQIERQNNASSLNWVSVCLNLVDSVFDYRGCTFTCDSIYSGGQNDLNYIIKYSFNNTLSNINGFYFFNEFNPIVNNPTYKNNFNFNNTTNVVFNNVGYSLASSGNFTACSLFVNTLDKTRFNSCSYRVYKTNSQSSYGFTINESSEMYLQLAVFTPLFFTNSTNFIASNSNGNMTPLQLNYYDAEWYQIHLQLANAFIFILTEFPLVSDITNLIYSLFVMIKNSFDVLLNFNGFGILFGFGMFAIVFGFIYKLIVGD